MPLLVDTGFLYALADADDDWHAAARGFLEARPDLLLAPAPILPEVSYLLRRRLGADAEKQFVESVAAAEIGVEDLVVVDYRRAASLMAAYGEIGFVDAAVVAVAERLRSKAIATTDRRHFAAIRPRHVEAFELVP